MLRPDSCSKSATPFQSRGWHAVSAWCHEWLVEDFARRDEGVGVSLSTRFSAPARDNAGAVSQTAWRLKLYPKGCDADNARHVSVFINQVSGPPVWAKYAISLLGCQSYDRSYYVYNTRKGSVQFLVDRRSASRGWKKFISHEAIGARSGSLLHDGGLLIRCVLELECRESNNEQSSQSDMLTSRSAGFDFSDAGMKYTDMCLEADGRDFRCHKFMLARKSDVFDAMFSHNFQESKSNRVVITDLESRAVEEMLRFIYTGRVHQMDQVNKIVLAAADKYNVVELIELCERSLCNSMTVDNVCSLLVFARDRLSQELKRKSIDFIAQNVEAVTNSDGWQDLVREPVLMTEVVRAMGPKSSTSAA